MIQQQNNSGLRLENLGSVILRYGLAIILIWVGFLKFSSYEAEAVHGLALSSPFLSWLVHLMTQQNFSNLLGVIEIILGILIAIKPVSPKASSVGSIGAIFVFLLTLTFVLSTPGVWQAGLGFPYLSGLPGQFLAKDLLFLGAAIYTAGDAIRASKNANLYNATI